MDESTSDPDPVLPSTISASLVEDCRAISRDLELSLVASLELNPFVKLPLPQMLLEPQALFAVPYVGFREGPAPLLSAVAALPTFVKDRDLHSVSCERKD